MQRFLALVLVASAVGLGTPKMLGLMQERWEAEQRAEAEAALEAERLRKVAVIRNKLATPGVPRSGLMRNHVALEADETGHYSGTFRIEGRPFEAVVDTGATLVALNRSAARRIGKNPIASDFRHTVVTANGEIKAAHIVLDEIRIGDVRVKDVDAFVLDDERLSDILIGMSFLKKLRRYGVENGRMVLSQ